MSQEDKLVSAFISDDHPFVLEQSPEVHYNHYGSRGVVDLVKKFSNQDTDRHVRTTLYEMKSEYALEQATGANEIIRQCKKHAEYYFMDKGNPSVDNKSLELVFDFTQQTHDHVTENLDMYRSVEQRPINGCTFEICLYDPDTGARANPLFVYDESGMVSELWESIRDDGDTDPFELAGVKMAGGTTGGDS